MFQAIKNPHLAGFIHLIIYTRSTNTAPAVADFSTLYESLWFAALMVIDGAEAVHWSPVSAIEPSDILT